MNILRIIQKKRQRNGVIIALKVSGKISQLLKDRIINSLWKISPGVTSFKGTPGKPTEKQSGQN